MNPPTPEEIAAVVRSSEIMASMAARAAKCDHLEARNKHIQEHSDAISARHGVLQAVIRKAAEGLGNAMPECRHMSLPELVVEAGARIRKPESVSSSADSVSLALRIARHLLNDLERVELGQQLLPHLRPAENVDTGALRILADRVEWLEGEAEQCRVMLHDVAAGRIESRVRIERDALQARVSRAEERANASRLENISLTGALGEAKADLDRARAENGRQAAVIAEKAMRTDEAERRLSDVVPDGNEPLVDRVIGCIGDLRQQARNWKEIAEQFCRNEIFCRDLLDAVAIHLGKGAYTADDGRVHDSPILLKIPVLVAKLVRENETRARNVPPEPPVGNLPLVP